MTSFAARLHMPGQTRLPLGVEVDISDERMTLTSGDRELGNWSLKDLDISSMTDGFHIELDDEEVVLRVVESDRFVSELGMVVQRPRPQIQGVINGINGSNGGAVTNGAPNGRVTLAADEQRFDDLRQRISDVAVALTSTDVSPAEAFGQWLRLLKEINVRHGQGAMPTPLYYRLNTQLLDLIPEPPRPRPQPVAQAAVGS